MSNGKATGIVRPAKGEFERLTSEDVQIVVYFRNDDTGAPVSNPTNFSLRFYVENRVGEFVCSRSGSSAPKNCVIENGGVVCSIPKNTFYEGRLMLEELDVASSDKFPDGNFEIINRHDLGILYIE